MIALPSGPCIGGEASSAPNAAWANAIKAAASRTTSWEVRERSPSGMCRVERAMGTTFRGHDAWGHLDFDTRSSISTGFAGSLLATRAANAGASFGNFGG